MVWLPFWTKVGLLTSCLFPRRSLSRSGSLSLAQALGSASKWSSRDLAPVRPLFALAGPDTVPSPRSLPGVETVTCCSSDCSGYEPRVPSQVTSKWPRPPQRDRRFQLAVPQGWTPDVKRSSLVLCHPQRQQLSVYCIK